MSSLKPQIRYHKYHAAKELTCIHGKLNESKINYLGN